MTPKEIRKIVEDYSNYLLKKEKLQKRLINLGGRDPEQEVVVLQRLEFLEQATEIIELAIYSDDILTLRESCAVEQRMRGLVYREIGAFLCLTRERVRQILNLAYIKIARAAGNFDVSIE